ncbi:hypothetical protein N656DRAFT_396195 [Canariomyces notabilis]|uniref:Uncharacterized protein n=1 Tax=Canariomyces notabilis TaxID=2074819 RepID=A0AAN6YVN0_9PEZI|nr:hypothetical protein N656DRAFT_396195 [Canariomyces arenarius]
MPCSNMPLPLPSFLVSHHPPPPHSLPPRSIPPSPPPLSFPLPASHLPIHSPLLPSHQSLFLLPPQIFNLIPQILFFLFPFLQLPQERFLKLPSFLRKDHFVVLLQRLLNLLKPPLRHPQMELHLGVLLFLVKKQLFQRLPEFSIHCLSHSSSTSWSGPNDSSSSSQLCTSIADHHTETTLSRAAAAAASASSAQ